MTACVQLKFSDSQPHVCSWKKHDKVRFAKKGGSCVLRNANDGLQHTHSLPRPQALVRESKRHVYFLEPRARVRADEAVARGMIMSMFRLFFSAVTVALVCGGTSPAQQTRTTWKDYLGGPDSSHYSALKQINTSNVNKLDVAWSY